MTALFARPGWLACALAVVPALAFLAARYARSARALEAIDSTPGTGGRGTLAAAVATRAVFLSLAWISLSVAAAGPRWGTELVAERTEGSCVSFVMDVSRSMTATDVSPDRLTFAARYASAVLSRLDDASVSVVLAKGEAHLAIPVTSDRLAAQGLFASLSPALLTAPGSNLAAALETAAGSFPSSLSGTRTVAFFTDGDETSGDVAAAAREAAAKGVTVVFVGIGTAEGADIPLADASGGTGTYRATLRDRTLSAAAKAAGSRGAYIDARDTGSALRLLSAIRGTGGPKAAGGSPAYKTKPVDRSPGFLVAALAFFCCSFLSAVATSRKEDFE